MNYVKILLITIALFNTYYSYNAEIASPAEGAVAQAVEKEESKVEEKTNLQKWNDHLDLLKTDDSHWDAANNNPTPEWKTIAFGLAKEILEQDKSMAESLKTDFINALNAKTTNFNDISKLIDEFKDLINAQTQSSQTKEEAPSVPAAPEATFVPEPVSEPTPIVVAQPETSTPVQDTTSTAATSEAEQAPQDIKSEWNTILESIKSDDNIGNSINRAYELSRELLLSGSRPIDLEKDLNAALETRMVQKKINPNVIKNEMNYFKMNLAQQVQPLSSQPGYPISTSPDLIAQTQQEQDRKMEFEKQQKIAEEKNAQLKEQQKKLEEQQKKQDEQNKILLAAAQKSADEGRLARAQLQQVHQSVQLQEEREAKIKKMHEKELAKIEKAQKDLAESMKQAMIAQKEEAEKGVLSTLSDWWYGTSAQKSKALSSKEEELRIDELVAKTKNPDAAKKVYQTFQAKLLQFNSPQYWDENKTMPNQKWIEHMSPLLHDIVVEYEIMSLTTITTNIAYALLASGKMSKDKIDKTLESISQLTKNVRAQQKQEKNTKEERNQKIKERKERIALEQQRIKAEEERMQAEKQRKKLAVVTYRDEKQQWYELLGKLAQNKQASAQDNHAHTQEALKKSQSLLQLAHDIPDKNKASIGQKLKQKFSVALLEQQKNGNGPVNIYQTMDLFNNEVNKMIE
jgi:hypothetical protein